MRPSYATTLIRGRAARCGSAPPTGAATSAGAPPSRSSFSGKSGSQTNLNLYAGSARFTVDYVETLRPFGLTPLGSSRYLECGGVSGCSCTEAHPEGGPG